MQCLQFPAWEQPLSPAWGRLRFSAWEHLPVPCLGHVCSPCLGSLPVPCLGTLASVHALPGHACSPCLGRLPVDCLGTLASSLPGNVCQCPAWARFAVPAWGAAWERLPMPFANHEWSALSSATKNKKSDEKERLREKNWRARRQLLVLDRMQYWFVDQKRS